LQRESARGTQTVDLGVGHNLLKRHFGTDHSALLNLVWVNPSRKKAWWRHKWLCVVRRLQQIPENYSYSKKRH
jgi:hypothetical protein